MGKKLWTPERDRRDACPKMLHHVCSVEEENNGEEFHMRDWGSSGMTQEWDEEQDDEVGLGDLDEQELNALQGNKVDRKKDLFLEIHVR